MIELESKVTLISLWYVGMMGSTRGWKEEGNKQVLRLEKFVSSSSNVNMLEDKRSLEC